MKSKCKPETDIWLLYGQLASLEQRKETFRFPKMGRAGFPVAAATSTHAQVAQQPLHALCLHDVQPVSCKTLP